VIESDLLRGSGIVGAIVANVLQNSPAANAGLIPLGRDSRGRIQLGDIIIEVDNKLVADGDDLLNILDEKEPGDKIQIKVLNNGEERTVTVKLGLLQ
jgi:S1-C subfamily serine protease